MDEPVFARDYLRIWLTSSTLPEVVRRAARELGLPLTCAQARSVARELRRRGARIPARPGGAARRGRLTLARRADGDYQDRRGREAYRVGPGTPLEGPWACARCSHTRLGGFMVLRTEPKSPRFVCGGCVRVAG